MVAPVLSGHVPCRFDSGLMHRRDALCSKCAVAAFPGAVEWPAPKGAKPKVVKRPGGEMEAAMLRALVAAGYRRDVDFVREYSFACDEDRGWRFDFAFPALRVAVELEGRVHAVNTRREADCFRASYAAAMGWRVMRVHKSMIEDGSAMELVKRAVAWRPS